MILYGSYARGTQSSESDVDIAFIMKRKGSEKMHDALIDAIVDLELNYNMVLSVVPIDYADYNNRNNIQPFYKNIKNEGIVLWKAA